MYLHCKKRLAIFPSPAGMSLTKLSLGGNNDVIYKLFPPRESFVSDIPAGDGKTANPFLQCVAAGAALSVLYRLISQDCTETEFLDVIGTKVLWVFLLAIPLEQKWFEIAFVCNANIVWKPQVWELAWLRPETSTKLYVHEFCFRKRSAAVLTHKLRITWRHDAYNLRIGSDMHEEREREVGFSWTHIFPFI